MSSLEEQLEDLLAPLQASVLGVSAAEGPEQLNKIQEALSQSVDPESGFAWLADRVGSLGPTAGSWLAVYLGGLVERGRLDARTSAPGVLRLFRSAVSDLTEEVNVGEWESCEGLLGPSVITQLSADRSTLASAIADREFVEQVSDLAETSAACFYVNGLVRQRSGELVLLDPVGRRGLVVAFANVGNCFHLFTLTQSVLPSTWSGGRSQLPEVLAVAWGENALTDATPGDSAWFHYSEPVADANVEASVSGEATTDSIGSLDGRRVLVAHAPVLGDRSWGASFFAPQLSVTPPSVSIIRPLETAEVDDLIGRLT